MRKTGQTILLKGNFISIGMFCLFIQFGPRRDKTCLHGFQQTRLNPVCPATKTSLKIEISLEASRDMIISSKRITKALIR